MEPTDSTALEDALQWIGGMSRRGFLKLSAASATLAAVAPAPLSALGHTALGRATAARGRVVRTRHPDATTWDFSTGWHGNYVDRAIVGALVDRGVMALTDTITVAQAWSQLIPAYKPGQKVAIKVNFNNCGSCSDSDNRIDALIEIVDAVIHGLRAIGVAPADIWVFDAVRVIPYRFRNRCRHPGVVFYDRSGSCGNSRATFGSNDPNASVTWTRSGMPAQRITDVVIDADYLINIPIMKNHVGAGVTLTFKNHFGTISSCSALHSTSWMSGSRYSSAHNPLVDIYANPHIADKTVLVLGDGLFASKTNQGGTPTRWQTFGNRSPNVLFFSQDPVAIDCVMHDHLAAETTLYKGCDDHLALAATRGLGVFEHASGGSYNRIDYRSLDLGKPASSSSYGVAKPGTGGVRPVIQGAGPRTIGNHLTLDVAGGLGGARGILLIGTTAASIASPLGTLLVTPVAVTLPLLLGGSQGQPGAGSTSMQLQIPNDVLLAGREFFFQAVVDDPGAAMGLSHSQGLKVTVGL